MEQRQTDWQTDRWADRQGGIAIIINIGIVVVS